MKRLDTNNVLEIAYTIGDAVHTKFGVTLASNVEHADQLNHETALKTPEQAIAPQTGPLYNGMQQYPANPEILIVPTKLNMKELSSNNGSDSPKVFGVLVDGVIRPGVITARSTAQELDIAYLKSTAGRGLEIDQIDPRNPVINPDWGVLLKQAASVQDRRVGASHASDRPMGAELGHAVLATAELRSPGTLTQGHVVHEWTKGSGGIAVATTSRGLYDFTVRDGFIRTREDYATVSEHQQVFLLKIPALDNVIERLTTVRGADLTIGLGLVAIKSQTGQSSQKLQTSLLATMEKL